MGMQHHGYSSLVVKIRLILTNYILKIRNIILTMSLQGIYIYYIDLILASKLYLQCAACHSLFHIKPLIILDPIVLPVQYYGAINLA